jgi:hypothetical protein
MAKPEPQSPPRSTLRIVVTSAYCSKPSLVDPRGLAFPIQAHRFIASRPRIDRRALWPGHQGDQFPTILDAPIRQTEEATLVALHNLQRRRTNSLAEILEQSPLEQGLAELVTYFAIAADDPHARIGDADPQTFVWNDAVRGQRSAQIPRVIFTRGARA